MKTNFKKVFRDITHYKGSSLLTLIGIFIGVTAFGTVLSAFALLQREMNTNFMNTNPASIVITVSNLDNQAVNLIKQSLTNADVDLRKTMQARISRGNGTYATIYLRAVQDFNHQKVDQFTLEKGQFPQNNSEMVLERDSLKILKNINGAKNEEVKIILPGGMEQNVKLRGKVHAPGLAPASMENYAYGFLTLDALQKLGYEGWYDEVRIVNYNNRFDQEKMNKLAADINTLLTKNNYNVSKIDVPKPGRHPHADQLDSLLFMIQAFAFISLAAACVIIINLISFILSKQGKQIAVMKVTGAGMLDITVPYLGYLLGLAVAAIILSLPVSKYFGFQYAAFAAGILNFNIINTANPFWVYILQILIGIIVTLAAGAYPIYKNCIKSIKEGLNEQIAVQSEVSNNYISFKRTLGRINSQLIMPINNLLRKKSRTMLAVIALAAGGAMFMTTQNIVASIDKTVENTFKLFTWDYEIILASTYPESKIQEVISNLKDIEKSEIWQLNTVTIKNNKESNPHYYPIKIIPQNSHMLGFNVSSLKDGVVINTAVSANEGGLKAGDFVNIENEGKTQKIKVSKIVKEVPAIPMIYMNESTFERFFGTSSKQIILAGAYSKNVQKQRELTQEIEAKFKAADIHIAENWNIFVLRKALVDHLHVILTFLSVIAALAIIVGALSIGSTVGINITERKREIGILQAVGANKRQIVFLILAETGIMGVLGWMGGVALSYPLSIVVGNYFGQIFLSSNLDNTVSMQGIITWFVISVCAALTAGLLPIRQAASQSLRNLLAYE